MERNDAVADKAVEELGALYRAELLDLLQKVAGEKFKNNQIIQAIITAKIASLQETTSALHAEVRMQVVESVSNTGRKEANTRYSRIRQSFDQLIAKIRDPKSKSAVPQSRFSSKGSASTSAIPASSNPSSSHAMLLGGLSRSTTIASSLNSTDCEVSSPADELELQEIGASSEKLNTYISTNLVDPFLQTIRSKMTRLADAHHMEKVYQSTILGMITDYEEALKKEVDQRQRTPEDRRVRSTLAQLQLLANITAAISAIEALSKARERAPPKLTDIGSTKETHMPF